MAGWFVLTTRTVADVHPLACFFLLIVLLVSHVDCSFHWRSQLAVTATPENIRQMAHPENVCHSLRDAAPLYITVGPQCCGKTTWIKQQESNCGGCIIDICLDDMRDVYVPVPTRCMLNIDSSPSNKRGYAKQDNDQWLLEQVLHGKSLIHRIQQDNVELRLVLQRWMGHLSAKDFELAMTKHLSSASFPGDVSDKQTEGRHECNKAWIATVEDFLFPSSPGFETPSPPEEIMVFCVESLFRPHPETNRSAIQFATELLFESAKARERHQSHLQRNSSQTPVAWGNTNAKPRDYVVALECAVAQGRPVYFVKETTFWDAEESPETSHTFGDKAKKRDSEEEIIKKRFSNEIAIPRMQRVPITTLWRRNLQRLSKTGKYIPASVIELCRQNVDQMLDQAYKLATTNRVAKKSSKDFRNNEEELEQFELAVDQALVSMAGNREFRYVMDDERRIFKLSHNNKGHPAYLRDDRHYGNHRYGGRGARRAGPRPDNQYQPRERAWQEQRQSDYGTNKRPRQSEGEQWRSQRTRFNDGSESDNFGNHNGNR